MRQCSDCEFCVKDDAGRIQLRCNPFENIKEPQCLQKWTLLKLDMMVRAYQTTLGYYQKFAPLQEKMLKYLEREIDDIQESDKWKYDQEDEQEGEDDDTDERLP